MFFLRNLRNLWFLLVGAEPLPARKGKTAFSFIRLSGYKRGTINVP